jgi:hypothetical protein
MGQHHHLNRMITWPGSMQGCTRMPGWRCMKGGLPLISWRALPAAELSPQPLVRCLAVGPGKPGHPNRTVGFVKGSLDMDKAPHPSEPQHAHVSMIFLQNMYSIIALSALHKQLMVCGVTHRLTHLIPSIDNECLHKWDGYGEQDQLQPYN